MCSTFRHRKHYHLVFLIQALLFGTTFPQRHIVHIHTHEPGCLGRTQAPRPQRIYISQVCQSINIKHLIAVQLLQTGDVPHTTPHPTSQTITSQQLVPAELSVRLHQTSASPPIRTSPQLLCDLKSWNSFKLLHPAATKPRGRDSEGFQWETFNWNIELKQIESTLLDTSSP